MQNLILSAALTIIIETTFLWLVGYKERHFVIVCILINFITNILLNMGLALVSIFTARLLLYPCEAVVVVVEWFVLSFLVQNKKRLLLFVLLSNALSYCIGLLIFGHI
jgi:hypothetical protein